MINLFRQNLFAYSLLILFYTALVRSKEFFGAAPVDIPGGIFYNQFIEILSSPLSQSIFAIVLIFIQAWLINATVQKNKLAKEITLLPGIFYVLLVSILPEFLGLSPLLIANTFLILAYAELTNIYRKPKSAVYLFNTGFYLSIAALIYFPFAPFILMGILGIIILNSFKLKLVLQYLTGYAVPIFLTYTFFLYSDQPLKLLESVKGVTTDGKFIIATSYDLYALLGMAVILLIVIFSYNGYMIKTSIQSQKKIDLIFWTLLFAGLSFFLMGKPTIVFFQILAFPLAVLIHMTFLKIKNYGLAELIHLIILATLFTLHFSLHLQFLS